MSKRFDDPTGGPVEPWRERHGHLLNSAADPRTVVLDGRHRDLLTGTDTTGAVDLGPEGAVALIERTS
jgi:beta-galactosidase